MEPDRGFEEWLRAALGRKLVRVLGTFFVTATEARENAGDTPIRLWLEFEGLPLPRVRVASDGWSLLTDRVPPEPIDMGSDGRIVVRDITASEPFGPRPELRSARRVRDDGSEVVGFAQRFADEAELLILNWGDELFVSGGELPPDATNESLEFLPI